MFNYPIFLNLSGVVCLVVGAGQVGCRKAHGLLLAGAGQVKMVAPPAVQPLACEQELMSFSGFVRLERKFEESDLDDCLLVYAATSCPALNAHIARLCQAKKCICNVASSLEQSQFILPALFQQNQIRVAVSTGGVSPTIAQEIRNNLAGCVQPKYQTQLEVLSELRPLILELGLALEENQAIFEVLAFAPFELFFKNEQCPVEYFNQHLPAFISLEWRKKIVEIVTARLKNI